MGNHIYKLVFVIGLFFAGNTLANHCSGGHKEVKDKKETTTSETSKEVKSN